MNTIREIRELLGLTQESLGKSLEVSQGNVAHYERGQTVPPEVAKKLITCAKDLGYAISLDQVYGLIPLNIPPVKKDMQTRPA